MLAVNRAEYVEDYKLRLSFNDGKTGEVDLHRTISEDPRSIVSELRDVDKFKDFRIDFDTVCWSNGLDLAPEYLYFLAFRDEAKLRPQFEKWGYWYDHSLARA